MFFVFRNNGGCSVVGLGFGEESRHGAWCKQVFSKNTSVLLGCISPCVTQFQSLPDSDCAQGLKGEGRGGLIPLLSA